MRKTISMLFGFLTLVLAAGAADAKPHRYRSRHPMQGGFCTIAAPHVHEFAPPDVRLYRVVRGEYYFVGDPVPFGYDGPRYAYYGAHPVVEAGIDFGEPVYCYLEGAHYHWYEPPRGPQFELRAGVSWYVGPFEAHFFSARPRYTVINHVYRPIRYARPVVEVHAAPAGWRGHPVEARPVGPGWRGVPPGHFKQEKWEKPEKWEKHGRGEWKGKGKGKH